MNGRYLMVLPVGAYRLSDDSFAIDSAFGEHLRKLQRALGDQAKTLVLAGPELSAEDYQSQRSTLLVVSESEESILFRPLFPSAISTKDYYKALPRIVRILQEEVNLASTVHGGASGLHRPFEFLALLMAAHGRKTSICVADIDQRKRAQMNLATGVWNRRQSWTTRYVHDVAWQAQLRLAARMFDVVLLKGQGLADTIGKGRPNVHNFLDASHGPEHLIPEDLLSAKQESCINGPALRLCFFGRLVKYKGILDMLSAVAQAVDGGAKITLEVIGSGPEEESLKAHAAALQLQSVVSFVPALPFGPALFERLYQSHVLLATPLSEDTPRSALDACAAGLMLLAYDTYYYKELSQLGAPVEVVPWRDIPALAAALVNLSENRQKVSESLLGARRFAEENTQEIWLQRRVEWTLSAAARSSSGEAQVPNAGSAGSMGVVDS